MTERNSLNGNPDSIVSLLDRVTAGDEAARERLLVSVYGELQSLARQKLSRGPRISVDPTELVHEMYARIFDRGLLNANSRRHFFGIAALAMHDIVIERARAAATRKRGGDVEKLPLSVATHVTGDDPEKILELADALARLTEIDEIAGEVVRLRYFVGLTGAEASEVLGVSEATVQRRWAYARAWLSRELDPDGPEINDR